MHLKHVIAFCLGVILVVGVAVVNKLNTPIESRIVDTAQKVSSLPINATYIIDGTQYQLFEGESKEEYRAGATTTAMVTLYEVPAYGDIDGDGDDDALVILMDKTGDGTTLYYAAIAWYEKGKYTGTDSVLLGDRVEIDTYEIDASDGMGRVTFRTHGEDVPHTDTPTIVRTIEITLNLNTGRIRTVNN